MKRLPFKDEFVPDIKSRKKRHTSRWECKWVAGETVAAVTAQKGKPAFLTPAKDRFATLKITSVESMFWKDFTEDHAKLCGVTRAWYLKSRPCAQDLDRISLIGFELIPKESPTEAS